MGMGIDELHNGFLENEYTIVLSCIESVLMKSLNVKIPFSRRSLSTSC